MKFRKKPVVIEAVQWLGNKESWDKIQRIGCIDIIPGEIGGNFFFIKTLEGNMKAEQNDWIIRGVNGEYYPCKPDIFEKTYEPADESPIKEESEDELWEEVRIIGESYMYDGGIGEEIDLRIGGKVIDELKSKFHIERKQQ